MRPDFCLLPLFAGKNFGENTEKFSNIKRKDFLKAKIGLNER
jgi:hypothetical protein